MVAKAEVSNKATPSNGQIDSAGDYLGKRKADGAACLAAALDGRRRGWSVLAICPPDHAGVGKNHGQNCTSPGKAPWGPWKEFQERLPTEGEIRRKWRDNPTLNVGLALGPVSGLVRVDIDGPAGEHRLQEISGGDLPPTLEFTSGRANGGRGLLYAIPEGAELQTTIERPGEAKQELRFQAKGAQTVLPPSRHPEGCVYAWIPGHGPEEIKPALAPQWLLEQLRPERGTGSKRQAHSLAEGEMINDGQRDSTLTSLAGGMRRRGMTYEAIRAALLAENEARCNPPLPNEQVEKIARSVSRYAPELGPNGPPSKPRPDAELGILLSTVKPERVEWLWPGHVPLGKLTILDGDPGLGKSVLTMDLAARVSRGWSMPFEDREPGQDRDPAGVVVLNAEDGLADTVVPRLLAAGGDLARVPALRGIPDGDGERLPSLPNDLPYLKMAIGRVGARLVIVDPIMAFLGGEVNAHRDQDCRRALHPLAAMAEETGAAVLVIRHLNKMAGGNPLYRGGGSIGIIGAARSGLLVAKDPDNPDRRILASMKCNLARLPPSLVYDLTSTDNGALRIGWMGESAHTAESLLAAPRDGEDAGAVQEAVDVLRFILESGPVPSEDVKKEARKAGISERTLHRAKSILDVKSRKVSFTGKGVWKWSLPCHSP